MNYLLDISFILTFTLLYMVGGQTMKWTRRILAPLIALGFKNGLRIPRKRSEWRLYATIFLIPILSMGYGINSSLMGISKRISEKHSEVLTRLIYSLLLVTVISVIKGIHIENFLPIIAFQVRAGGYTVYKSDRNEFHFLFEDLARGFSIAYALT